MSSRTCGLNRPLRGYWQRTLLPVCAADDVSVFRVCLCVWPVFFTVNVSVFVTVLVLEGGRCSQPVISSCPTWPMNQNRLHRLQCGSTHAFVVFYLLFSGYYWRRPSVQISKCFCMHLLHHFCIEILSRNKLLYEFHPLQYSFVMTGLTVRSVKIIGKAVSSFFSGITSFLNFTKTKVLL